MKFNCFFSARNIILPFSSYRDLKWTDLVLTAQLQWQIWCSQAGNITTCHVTLTKPSLLGCLWSGDTCNFLIEYGLSWMEPPVFSLCENMLMQINANYVVLYMQISHAATLWLLFFQRQTNLCECVCVYLLMFGCMSGVCAKTAPSTRLTAINTQSSINSTILTGFTAWTESRKTLLQGLRV